MKTASYFIFLLFIACADKKERAYTGSTPANAVVRSFLGISLADSIDFIRWNLTLQDDQYSLNCNYGIGKPNTNGFYDGGKKIDLKGSLKKEKNYLNLQNGSKSIRILELNDDLLHLLNDDNSLLIGNGGWSYTLNNLAPVKTDNASFISKQISFKDSMVFQGRTPCAVPGIIPSGSQCYKLKWLLTLYAKPGKNEPTTYKLWGTPWYEQGGRKGTWQAVIGKDDRIIYQLNDEKGKAFIYLLKLDDNILIFTDVTGKLLTGDLDFSYTLNRRL